MMARVFSRTIDLGVMVIPIYPDPECVLAPPFGLVGTHRVLLPLNGSMADVAALIRSLEDLGNQAAGALVTALSKLPPTMSIVDLLAASYMMHSSVC
jgi:hypothetical protein